MKILKIGDKVECYCPYCKAFLEINNNDWRKDNNGLDIGAWCPCCNAVIPMSSIIKQIQKKIDEHYKYN